MRSPQSQAAAQAKSMSFRMTQVLSKGDLGRIEENRRIPSLVIRPLPRACLHLYDRRMRRQLWMNVVLLIVFFVLACGSSGLESQPGANNRDTERRRMVDEQLRARDIRSGLVLDAMLKVPRHVFVPEPQRALAYT